MSPASSFTDLKKCLEVTNAKVEGQQSNNLVSPGDKIHSVNQIMQEVVS